METYLRSNNIIFKNHHGSQKYHGTNTALTQTNNEINTQYEINAITAAMATNLPAAFDTIDNTKLIDKLHFYGIEGRELEILKSFLSERTEYVQLTHFKSEATDCPPCSVIQGSKLSAVLYTIYTNEIPFSHTLMSQEIFQNLTNTLTKQYNDIQHTTVYYVDDSTSTITSNNLTQLQTYLHNYYKLLEIYHNIKFLKINPDKSKFIITCKPCHRQSTKDIFIQAGTFITTQSDKPKILGTYITNGLDQHLMSIT